MKARGKVFISYRRQGGAEMARIVREGLRERAYDVFMDVENLRSGPFNTALLKEIESSTDFVVVLTPHSLERCASPDDWLRLEIAHAIKCGKNIVPVRTRGFEFAATPLPDELKELPNFQSVEPSHEFHSASMDKLAALLVGAPGRPVARVLARIGLAALAVIAGFLIWQSRHHVSSNGESGTRNPANATSALSVVEPAKFQSEAEGLYNAKDYAGAFHAFSRLADGDPGRLDYHRRIEDCARQGHLENAFLARYAQLTREHPENAVYWNYLGNAFLMIDPNDAVGKAEQAYQKALVFDARLSPPLANRGIIAFRHGDFAGAESLFRKYLDLEPQDPEGWLDLGLLYVARLQKGTNRVEAAKAAEEALLQALHLKPALAGAYKGLGQLYSASSRTNEALNAFQKSLALNYDQPEVRQQIELLALGVGGKNPADDLVTRTFSRADPVALLVVAAMKALEKGDQRHVTQLSREIIAREPENPLPARLILEADRTRERGLPAGLDRAGTKKAD